MTAMPLNSVIGMSDSSPGMGRVTAHPRFDAVDHSVAWE